MVERETEAYSGKQDLFSGAGLYFKYNTLNRIFKGKYYRLLLLEASCVLFRIMELTRRETATLEELPPWIVLQKVTEVEFCNEREA